MSVRPKYVVEYLLLRGVCGLISLLPYRAALIVAAGIAKIVYWLAIPRRRDAIRRIQQAMGPDFSKRDARRAAWQSFRNMAFNLVEMIYMSGHGRPRPLPRPMEMDEALEKFKAYTRAHPNQGGIFACAHMGNWELAGIVAPQCGIRMFSIIGEQKNPLVNQYLVRLRLAPHVELISRRDPTVLRKILGNLNDGKFMAIMPDLRSRNPGISVQFFGGTANVYPGMGQIARQANVPIFLAITKRIGWTRHTLTLYGPFLPNPETPKKEDVQRLFQDVMDVIDAEVRKDPGQWFWYNRRWILEPLDKPQA